MNTTRHYGNLSLIVLALLSERDMYGYEISELVMNKSQMTIDIKAGTLYPLLKSLETQKLVVSYEELTANGKKRKYYRITPSGIHSLEKTKNERISYTKIINLFIAGEGLL